MAISPSSIFHFTSGKDFLKGILEDNFKIKYCKETIYFGEKYKFNIFVPMVSFCDIPLSQVKDHIGRYGDYGIGLNRDWAIKNKLNPVLYLEPDSLLAESYDKAMSHFAKLRREDDEEYHSAYCHILNIIRYLKPYERPLERKGERIERYRFSDEREWRYVPPIDAGHEMYYMKADFNNPLTKDAANKSIADFRLAFEPDDIKYIIVKDESEIREFVRHLDDVKGGKFSSHGLDKLTTRIITSEQIRLDF